MAIVLTHVGTTSSKAGPSSLSVTVGAGGVPTGCCLFVFGTANAGVSTNIGNASDSKNNTYQNPASLRNVNTGPQQMAAGIGYCYNVTSALVSGDTISIAITNTSASCALTVFYATGLDTAADPLDTGTIAITMAASPPGTVTMAAAPATASSLVLAGVGYRNLLSAFVQDSTNAAYATPPNGVGTTGSSASGNCTAAGGTIVSSSQLTYAPTTLNQTTLIIAAFAPAAASDTLMAASWM